MSHAATMDRAHVAGIKDLRKNKNAMQNLWFPLEVAPPPPRNSGCYSLCRPSPSHEGEKGNTCAVGAPSSGFTDTERMYWWSKLTHVVKIQVWWRGKRCLNSVEEMKHNRLADNDKVYLNECAEMIQRCWRSCIARRRFR